MTGVPEPVPDASAPARLPRADALDALRGFAILTMCLSGLIPFGMQANGTHLPAWMYHAQVPPPAHVFNPNSPGLTWVDLVFPFFLFSLGAAIPLALARRAERGEPTWRLGLHAVQRLALLLAFAIYVQAMAPGDLSKSPHATTWLTALLGFVLLYPALMRLPGDWLWWKVGLVRLAGWGGGITLALSQAYRDGQGFDPLRSDIIIVVLANVACSGTLLWLVSRSNWALRLGFMLALLGLRLSRESVDWMKLVWSWPPLAEGGASPLAGLYQVAQPYLARYLQAYYHQYLLIVMPGTIVGDILLKWLRERADERPGATGKVEAAWSHGRYAAIAAVMLGLAVFLLCGLQARWLPWTTFVALAACALGVLMLGQPAARVDVLIRDLYRWGVLWLIVGLLFEPFEGGIKKDRATVSYYLVTSGLACFALVFFTIAIDVFKQRRALFLLIDSGQNPMITYAARRSLLDPVCGLTGLDPWLTRLMPTPWLGVLRGGIKTALLAAFTSLCTRLHVFWRT